MGIFFSRLFQSLFGSKEVRILILGLDNAGKTTILYRLQNDDDAVVQTIPTIGFNVEVRLCWCSGVAGRFDLWAAEGRREGEKGRGGRGLQEERREQKRGGV